MYVEQDVLAEIKLMHSLYIEVMGERLLRPFNYLDNMHEDFFFSLKVEGICDQRPWGEEEDNKG